MNASKNQLFDINFIKCRLYDCNFRIHIVKRVLQSEMMAAYNLLNNTFL